MTTNFRKYPNTPTAAERKRHTLTQAARAAAAVLLTAATTAALFALFIITH